MNAHQLLIDEAKKRSNKFSSVVRGPDVRSVQVRRGECPSLWPEIESIAPQFGRIAQAQLGCVMQSGVVAGTRTRTSLAEQRRAKATEREVKDQRRTDEILGLDRAFFVQAELDRRLK